jgi:hypothetical protein
MSNKKQINDEIKRLKFIKEDFIKNLKSEIISKKKLLADPNWAADKKSEFHIELRLLYKAEIQFNQNLIQLIKNEQ